MAALSSCLYECEVYHQRLSPRKHAFTNRLFFFYLDLDELPRIGSLFKLLKIEKQGWFSFRAADHLPKYSGSLKERVVKTFQDAGVSREIHQVFLLAQVRTLGYVFNPISLFYAVDDRGDCLGVLAQVENTFREMKLFPVLNQASAAPGTFLSEHIKWFYVSPYSSLEQSFQFEVKAPADLIQCHISSHHGDQAMLNSGFHGKKLALNERNLFKMALRYPLLTWQMITLIHLHAMVLWIKRVPFFLKENELSRQREVLRPRADLQHYYQEKEVNP